MESKISTSEMYVNFYHHFIQPSGSTLNVEANKQRALLRQKGSLAGRRKPTRASLRATAHNDQPQVIETVAGKVNMKTKQKRK